MKLFAILSLFLSGAALAQVGKSAPEPESLADALPEVILSSNNQTWPCWKVAALLDGGVLVVNNIAWYVGGVVKPEYLVQRKLASVQGGAKTLTWNRDVDFLGEHYVRGTPVSRELYQGASVLKQNRVDTYGGAVIYCPIGS